VRSVAAGTAARIAALIFAKLVFREDGMAVFDCRIDLDDVCVATAQLTLYQPKDEASFLSDQSVG